MGKQNKCALVQHTCRECAKAGISGRGGALCEHNRVKKCNCRERDGSLSLCFHKKLKCNCCRERDGTSICAHKKRKYDCRECGGIDVFVNNKRKLNCGGGV